MAAVALLLACNGPRRGNQRCHPESTAKIWAKVPIGDPITRAAPKTFLGGRTLSEQANLKYPQNKRREATVRVKPCSATVPHQVFYQRANTPLKQFPGSQPILLCYKVTTLDLLSVLHNRSAFGSLIPSVGSSRGSLRSLMSNSHYNIEMKRFKNTKEASRRRRLRIVDWGGSCSGFSSFGGASKDEGK